MDWTASRLPVGRHSVAARRGVPIEWASIAEQSRAEQSTARHIGKAADPVTTGITHALTACVLISHCRISLQVGCELAQFFMVFVRPS